MASIYSRFRSAHWPKLRMLAEPLRVMNQKMNYQLQNMKLNQIQE